jgi:C1A family cysteine protease
MRLGYLDSQEPNAEDNGVLSDTSAKAAIPAHFDWRNVHGYNYVTNIKDQGNCGSCWAFSSTAALESHVLITKFTYLNLSEQILVSCDRKDLGCGGGWLNYAANFIRDKGLPAEQYYPYTATNGVCASAETEWWRNTYKIVSWHYVGSPNKPNLVMIKKALVTYGPLVTTFRVYSDFLYYSSSVYQYTSGDLLGGHAVVIVGYDDAEQYFIVKNSWGIDWGESGYFRIGYSELSSVVEFGFSSIAYLSDRIHEWFNQFGLRTW